MNILKKVFCKGKIKNQILDLNTFIKKYKIKKILDCGCGTDIYWLKNIHIHRYIGFDVNNNVIQNNKRLDLLNCDFFCLNLKTNDFYPKVDLILCKSFLGTFENNNILSILERFKQSKSKYLLIYNSNEIKDNEIGYLGGTRQINYEIKPFELINYNNIQVIFKDKNLTLYKL